MKLIFELGTEGRGLSLMPACDVPEYTLPEERTAPLRLPHVSENELTRHYTALCKRIHGVNDGFYPLGSCTMKYNPKIDEDMAALPGFTQLHPLQPVETAQGALEALHVLGSELGEIFGMDIDDYVTKPFSMPVLLEKIRVILRRRGTAGEDSRLRYRDLTLDLDTREALLDGRLLDLTAREFELLHTFLAAPGRVFTREMLLAKLWGYDFYGDERVVDSHIKNLRHKLGRNYIDTVRGVGYRAAKEDH